MNMDSGSTIKHISKSQMQIFRMNEKLSFQSCRFLYKAIRIKMLPRIPAIATVPRTTTTALTSFRATTVVSVTSSSLIFVAVVTVVSLLRRSSVNLEDRNNYLQLESEILDPLDENKSCNIIQLRHDLSAI